MEGARDYPRALADGCSVCVSPVCFVTAIRVVAAAVLSHQTSSSYKRQDPASVCSDGSTRLDAGDVRGGKRKRAGS